MQEGSDSRGWIDLAAQDALLENEGVAIGEISPEVPEEFIERMNELEERILSGEIDPPTTV